MKGWPHTRSPYLQIIAFDVIWTEAYFNIFSGVFNMYVGFQTQIDSLRGRVQSGKEPIGVHHVGRALALIVPLLPHWFLKHDNHCWCSEPYYLLSVVFMFSVWGNEYSLTRVHIFWIDGSTNRTAVQRWRPNGNNCGRRWVDVVIQFQLRNVAHRLRHIKKPQYMGNEHIPAGGFGGETSNYTQTLTEIIFF